MNKHEAINLAVEYLWQDIVEVQLFATNWMYDYNHDRPHMALEGMTPKQRLTMVA